MIEHQINRFLKINAGSVVARVGVHDNVKTHLERRYIDSQTPIHSINFTPQLGNGGDLIRAIRYYSDYFRSMTMIVNVDTILDIDELAFLKWHQSQNALLTIALTERKDVPNHGAYYVDAHNKVFHSIETNSAEQPIDYRYRASSTGAIIVDTNFIANFNWKESDGPISIYHEIMKVVIQAQNASVYNNAERFFMDIGTVDSWEYAIHNNHLIQPYLTYDLMHRREYRAI